MVQAFAICSFLLSFILILKGGEMLVDSAIVISKKAKIPPMIVGATVVSLATTLPETTVSLLATMRGDYPLASGNAFGSMICNFALILGIAFTFLPSTVDRHGFKLKCTFLVIDLLLLTVFAFDGAISVFEGSILLVLLFLFMLSNFLEAKHSNNDVNLPFEKNSPKTVVVGAQFVVGALAIAFGSHVLVVNSNEIGAAFGIGKKFLALTIVAIGTGLPEIVTTITSIRENNAGIGVGNMIGANIINGSELIGLCGVLAKGKLVLGKDALVTFVVLYVVYFVAIVPTVLRGKTRRWQGIVLLLVYVLYIIRLALL